MERDINLEIKAAQRTPNMINSNQPHLTHHNQTTENPRLKKILKGVREKITHFTQGHNDLKECEHLRNHRGQKKVDQHLSSAERPRMRWGLYLREIPISAG